MRMAAQLLAPIGLERWMVRIDSGRLSCVDETSCIFDLFTAPSGVPNQDWERFEILRSYGESTLLVINVWSPLTGSYDVEKNQPEYRLRRNLEILRIHPFGRTLFTRRRQWNGHHAEPHHRDGTIEPAAVPGVRIDLDELFRH